jgi:SAM-dependent methyltransferase
MGLDSDGTKFLFAAQAAGVSFRSTAMLGRQNFFPEASQLQRLLDSRQSGLSAADFLADSRGYAEKLFHFLGGEEIAAIDNSDYEGASIAADMNGPIDPALKNRFTAIFDGGCLEHVFNFPQAIKNCMEMLCVGGHFIAVTPANNFCGHGFYQFSPELFFRIFSEPNGFALRAVLTKEKDRWFRVIDPKQFGARVELQNNRPTYLFLLTRKIEDREIFRQHPQQSDYARQWRENAAKDKATPGLARDLPKQLRDILPIRLKKSLRPFAANVSIRHRYSCYQPIDENALLRGDFAI